MKSNRLFLRLALIVGCATLLSCPAPSSAQAVAVTLQLDTNSISAGGTTFLHVFAQVVPALRGNSDRIFAWYVDVLNNNGAVAVANYAALQKPTSDNDPLISSSGTTQGADRHGIYDTFLNLPGAGVANPVELIRIPVTGQSGGSARFSVQAGTGVSELSSDFLVVPAGAAGEPFTGGDYSAASATLQVSGTGCNPALTIAQGAGGNLTLSFPPCSGRTHIVEARSGLADATGWQALPGAPHNSGSVTVANQGGQRFFRLRITTP